MSRPRELSDLVTREPKAVTLGHSEGTTKAWLQNRLVPVDCGI